MRCAIIVAGGSGERFGRAGGKQLARANGRTLLAHTMEAFERCDDVDGVVLVCHPDRIDEYRRAAVEETGARKVIAVVAGGDVRRRSVRAGLAALPPDCTHVAVHDGARALIEPATIAAAFAALDADPMLDGAVVGHPCYDTVKEVDGSGTVLRTPDRSSLWVAQTPQAFRADAIRKAHDRAEREGFDGTDDASLVERDGGTVRMVQGPRWNLKVTVPEDIEVLEALVRIREEIGGSDA